MTCSDFLTHYSSYRDGLAQPAQAAAMLVHLSVCPSCARYDRAVREGVEALRNSSIEPSSRSRVRIRVAVALTRRIRHTRFSWPAALAASLVVTAVFVEGVTHSSQDIQRAAPLPSRPAPRIAARPSYPFVAVSDLHVGVFETELPATRSSNPLDYNGRYRAAGVRSADVTDAAPQ